MQEQARAISERLRVKYGAGWALLSDDQQRNAKADELLCLLLSQLGPEYRPAQDMVRGLLNALG